MIRSAMRKIYITLVWLWVALFVAVAVDFVTDGVTANLLEIFLALAIASVPLYPLWSARRHRRQAEASRELESALDSLVGADRDVYEKLRDAHAEARNLVDRGIVPAAALADVSDTIEHLGVLLRADAQSSRLGGRVSTKLRDAMRELTDGLVALIDLAVDRETAALETPVNLHEALEVLEAHVKAHNEIQDLT